MQHARFEQDIRVVEISYFFPGFYPLGEIADPVAAANYLLEELVIDVARLRTVLPINCGHPVLEFTQYFLNYPHHKLVRTS